jgi:hypothetical protein
MPTGIRPLNELDLSSAPPTLQLLLPPDRVQDMTARFHVHETGASVDVRVSIRMQPTSMLRHPPEEIVCDPM